MTGLESARDFGERAGEEAHRRHSGGNPDWWRDQYRRWLYTTPRESRPALEREFNAGYREGFGTGPMMFSGSGRW